MSAPENITVEIEVPTRVEVGEQFNVIANITNTGSDAQELNSIDIGDEYLEGVIIYGSEPAYSETFHVPIDNTISHSMMHSIEAGETLSVSFDAEALIEGDYSGAFDVCVNGPVSCLYYSIRTLVE